MTTIITCKIEGLLGGLELCSASQLHKQKITKIKGFNNAYGSRDSRTPTRAPIHKVVEKIDKVTKNY